ncbi:Gfo/Idh/MocA family oxidoreductase [Chitinophagaceae bacterium LB-8]|uniref:Gfo/Idh/MocA family oxidoreductase n=1 Tax=Paraflavisolibacter caeni TaxID=2982496 RepID=A0A9X2XX35_9BACT|nr:Gfo/Idh/MocA family oxidoreductase [Paraflavisolibacter caeni]MCU7550321.1 Gfo/Idh/MocA family oxidoreductase [Paraflavisolibacter caeni]
MNKIRWGILSTAKIGREKVIPALQKGKYCDVIAIASRNIEQAQAAAKALGIPKVYGTYEELLSDSDINAIYIPLPNHMHVEWAMKALEAGKHVLCEKPIGLSSAEAIKLLDAAQQMPHLKIMEAFMYRFHPQWQHVKKLVDDGSIGTLKTVQSFFSYYNVDMNNIRNRKDAGGGGIMDIGCYCISIARFLFNREPERVVGTVEYDPNSQTDRLASGILDFSTGTSTFTCSTQLMPYQRVNILGTEGRIEIEIPVNAPPDKPTRIWLHLKEGTEEIVFDPVDQYTLQGDAFSKAILENTPVPTDLEDAINNMKVIEALFQSFEKNTWQKP